MSEQPSAPRQSVPQVHLLLTVEATGLAFPEGPCIDERGDLILVEMANRRVSVIRDGHATAWVSLPGSPNGAAFGPDRHLYVCDGGGRWPPFPSTGDVPGPGDQPGLIWQVSPNGSPRVLIREIDSRPLNAPNDICFDDSGGFYFTDPVWIAADGADGIRRGEVCYSHVDGSAVRVHSGLRFPNGLHVTPDGTRLLVGETDTGLIHQFPILGPGRLGESTVYAELGLESGPDGMCFDAAGRLIVAASMGGCLYVIAQGGGSIEKVIASEDPCPTNVCFGGPDHRTLFVTEGGFGRVISLRWETPGLVLFPDRAVVPDAEG